MRKVYVMFAVLALLVGIMGCATPLSTREKGATLGTIIGAGLGAIIGSTTGRASEGAAIGGGSGLLGGALIGDQLGGQEETKISHERQLQQVRAELDRQKEELDRLKAAQPLPTYRETQK